MIFEVFYHNPAKAVVGPRLHFEAQDEEHARDLYILDVDPVLWQDHWTLRRDQGLDSAEFCRFLECIKVVAHPSNVEVERRKPKLTLIRGGKWNADNEQTPTECEKTLDISAARVDTTPH